MAVNSEKTKINDAASWMAEVDKFINGKTPQELSTGGVFFNPDIREDGPSGKHGGFFPAITEQNREAAIRRLLKDQPDNSQWFVDYINKGKNDGLSAEQEQFVASYDRFMSSFLDSRSELGEPQEVTKPGVFTSEDFARMATKDQTLTDAEYRKLMKEGDLDEDVEKMGSLGLPFIYLTGGIVQGAIDYETEDGPLSGLEGVYLTKELEPFYSSEAKRQLEKKNDHSYNMPFLNAAAHINQKFPEYVTQMGSICGRDTSLEFKPLSTTIRILPENQESYER